MSNATLLPVYTDKNSTIVEKFVDLAELNLRAIQEHETGNFYGMYVDLQGNYIFVTQDEQEFIANKLYAIQDSSKLSGNNLLDWGGHSWDAEPKNAMEFSTKSEAEEFIKACEFDSFATVIEL